MNGFRPFGRAWTAPLGAAVLALAAWGCAMMAGPGAGPGAGMQPASPDDVGYRAAVLDRVAPAWRAPSDMPPGTPASARRGSMGGAGDDLPTIRVQGAPRSGLEVAVELAVGLDGKLQGAQLVRSSGDPTFDAAALQACWDGGPYPAVPDALQKPGEGMYRFQVRFVAD
jgi:TonB family protein